MLMTLYFNGVQNYSQDFTLPYGPIYESYNMTHYIEHYHIAYQGAGMLQ